MRIRKLSSLVVGALALGACSGVDGLETDLGESRESILRPTANGGRNEVVMLYVKFIDAQGFLRVRTCTGSYFAPRVVLTAAHCLQGAWLDQVFVYHGDNYQADFAQLTPLGDTLIPPALGQPSFWAQADSFEQHPQWDPSLKYPDMGVVYLDRKLPFDPMPLFRQRLDNSFNNRQVAISGWGANSAPTPTTGAGAQVQRTGTTRLLGSPTLADYYPEDPNPGILQASIRNHVIKTDGRAPNSNACFGDSGGPILLTQWGQTYIAGVSYFTGLSCEVYGLYTRLDPFLPFLDQAYKKGGQETLIPRFECAAPNARGGLTAYFGYENKNGVALQIPYGPKNQAAQDTAGFRATHFEPGLHPFAFGIDFGLNETLSYKLSPDNSPTTTLTVNKNSLRCGAAEANIVECGNYCGAVLRSGCTGLPSYGACLPDCTSTTEFFEEFFPDCADEYHAFNACFGSVPPGGSNWTCFEDGGFDAPACAPAWDELSACLDGSL